MTKDNKFSIRGRFQSMKHAFAGLVQFFKTEHNARVHLLAAVVVIILSLIVGVTRIEAILLIIAVAFVWITEMLNTCIEKAMDRITKEHDLKIKVIKDISAGAVLVAAFASLLIGLLVFIPKFVHI